MSDEKDLMWETVNVEHVIQDRWIDFRKNTYRLPDGSVIEPVYNFSRNSFVVVVAKDEKDRYICVRQYRHGIDAVTVEFPAGAIEYLEKSDVPYMTSENIKSDIKEATEAAKRELLEETGYAPGSLRHLLTVPSNATMADNDVYVFAADNCRKVDSQHLDSSEFINVELYTEKEMKDMILSGNFKQAIHIMAYYLAAEKN